MSDKDGGQEEPRRDGLTPLLAWACGLSEIMLEHSCRNEQDSVRKVHCLFLLESPALVEEYLHWMGLEDY